MTKTFQKNVENFTCEHCGEEVIGSGYTNHCPKCLWSKHVDVNPGDRASECGGMMEPEEVTITGSEHVIVHRCITCGHVRKNKVAPEDDFDELLKIASKQALK